jgi:hypothetical protein
VGNAKSNGIFSATVQLLTAVAFVTGACAYAVNYPPAAKYTAANKVEFTGTPPYHLTFALSQPVDLPAGSITIPAADYLVSFSDQTGAPGRITPFTYTLNVSGPAYCAGGAGVTFALSGTQPGVSYRLYKDGAATGTALSGTGSPATFSGMFPAGVYTARSVAAGVYEETTMAGTRTVTTYPVFTRGSISTTGQSLCKGATLNIITGGTAASGGDGTITYQWTYAGTSAGTLSTNSASLTPPASLKNAPGTYTFKRWAKDATCNTTWTQSTGEWVIKVNALPSISIHPQPQTLCGSVFSLTVTATPGSGSISTYQWKKDGVNVGTNSNTYTETGTATATYTVVVTNSNGCSVTSNPATVTLTTGGSIGSATACTGTTPGSIGANVSSGSCSGTPGAIGF